MRGAGTIPRGDVNSNTISTSASSDGINSIAAAIIGAGIAGNIAISVGLAVFYYCGHSGQTNQTKQRQPSVSESHSQLPTASVSSQPTMPSSQVQQQQPQQPYPQQYPRLQQPYQRLELPADLQYKDLGRDFTSVMAQSVQPVPRP